MRHDQRADFAEILISAGVIEMPVRVDEEPNGIGAKIADRSLYAPSQRGELIVDQNGSVLTIGHADIATAAEQDGDARAQVFGPNFDIRHFVILCTDGRSDQQDSGGRDGGE